MRKFYHKLKPVLETILSEDGVAICFVVLHYDSVLDFLTSLRFTVYAVQTLICVKVLGQHCPDLDLRDSSLGAVVHDGLVCLLPASVEHK
jgi:hypothetical protein